MGSTADVLPAFEFPALGEWGPDDQLQAILSDPTRNPDEAAGEILGLFAELEADAAREAFDHLMVLVPEEDYALLVDLSVSGAAPEGSASQLVEHLAYREPILRLPSLVRIAQATSDELLRASVVTELTQALGEDFGTNWAGWVQAVDARLSNG